MSGHSKWSTIKHKKAAKDARRGKLFTKLIKEITVAARAGGGDINADPRLRTTALTARANSMPGENIDRAIKKGTGELEGVNYEEIQYEGYGPGGAAILAQVLTDNKNPDGLGNPQVIYEAWRKSWRDRVRLLDVRQDGADHGGKGERR